MSENLYMDGRGVLKRTHDLNEKLYDQVVPAIFGASAAICGVIFAPLTWFMWGQHWLVIPLLAIIPIGIYFARPWHRVRAEIRKHRAAMEAETAKHGKGWARD